MSAAVAVVVAAAAAAGIYVKQQLLHIYAILADDGLAPPFNSLAEPAFGQKIYTVSVKCRVK